MSEELTKVEQAEACKAHIAKHYPDSWKQILEADNDACENLACFDECPIHNFWEV